MQRLSESQCRLLSTHLLKSTSTARWVTSAHGRALTIIAEGQHPATPCGHLCLRKHLSRCSQLMLPPVSVRTILAYIQFLDILVWTIIRTAAEQRLRWAVECGSNRALCYRNSTANFPLRQLSNPFVSPSGEYCHKCDSFCICQRSRTLKGLFRSL